MPEPNNTERAHEIADGWALYDEDATLRHVSTSAVQRLSALITAALDRAYVRGVEDAADALRPDYPDAVAALIRRALIPKGAE
jgi:ligand-binding sensor domain-containing protein